MKNILMMMALACAALFLTQCRKAIFEQTGGNLTGETIEVSLNVDNGGSKTGISPSGVVTWNQGDKIYVVGGHDTDGGYLGCLTAQNSGQSAYFTGTIRKTAQTQYFHYYYVGNNTFPTDGADYKYDISVQNGKLADGENDDCIAKKLHLMHCSAEVAPGVTNLGTITMESMMSMAKLQFSKSGDIAESLVCYGVIPSATLNTKTGELTNGTPDFVTLGGVKSSSRGNVADETVSDDYYMVLIPGSQTLTFANERLDDVWTSAKKTKDIVPNMLYTSNGQADGPAVTVALDKEIAGALPGRFSVGTNSKGAKKYTYFSKGNLQYRATEDGVAGDLTHQTVDGPKNGEWRFAEKQYGYIGEDNKNISDTYNGWIDLFGWGTSGYGSSAPYNKSTKPEDYAGNSNSGISGTNYDWGVYNAINNGGNDLMTGWRTLTNEEWEYLSDRKDGNSKVLYGQGKVGDENKYCGMIILPDGWTWAGDLVSYEKTWKSGASAWLNQYGLSDWSKMETAGALFLPAAGYREGTALHTQNSYGDYWYSSFLSGSSAGSLSFKSSTVNLENKFGYRYRGFSVRLIHDIK